LASILARFSQSYEQTHTLRTAKFIVIWS